MAKLSYSEWLNQKKEGASAPSISDAPANKPATNTQITGSNGSSGEKPSYSEWLSARREKEATESVDGWINQSINTLNSINNYYSSWRGGDDPQYGAYQQQLSKYLSQADNWRKMYSGNEDAIAAINEVVSYLSGAKYNTMAIKDFYSRWGTEEDYLKWDAYRTPENRHARYAENQARLEELYRQRDAERARSSQYSPGQNPYTSWNAAASGSVPYGAARQAPEPESDLDREIAAIEAEILMYERGGTDENGFYYGSKVIDDYGKLRDNADFGAVSGIRTYHNAGKDELDAYDASQSEGSLALNNGGYYDEQGNIRDAKGNIVQYANAPAVEDKLGMFLAASDEDIADAYNLLSVSGGNYETTWADIMQEGETQRWKYLTDGEIDIYYYLLGSQGQEAAYKYLDDMEVELGRRENEETYAAIEGANGWEKAGLSALSVFMNMAGGIASTVDNASRLIRGNELNPYSRAQSLTNASGYIRSATARDIIEATGGVEIPGLGFSAGDAYQAGMSMIDSLVGARLGGTAYQAIMSMGAASSEANRLYDQGASMDQIVLGSAAAGTAEWFFEKYSIENLISMKSPETIGQFLKNAFIQGGIEFSEEAATEIANIISNGLIMQSQSDWEKLLEENGGDYGAAIKEMAIQVTNAGLGGFLSGFGSGAIQQGIAYGTQQKQNGQIGQYISGGDGTDALMALALDMASGSDGKSQRRLRSQVNSLMGDKYLTQGGRNLATGRLYNTVRSVMTEQNIGEISAALQEQGFSKKDASKIAGALAMNYNGIELTAQQEKLVQKYGNDQKVLDAISKVIDNGESGIRQRANSMARFEFGTMLGNVASRMNQEAPGQEKSAAEGNLSGENSAVQTDSYEVSDDGQTRLISDPEKVVSVAGIASLENGKVMLQLKDGSTVDAEDVSFGDSGDALIYATAAGLGLSVDTANTIIGAFDSGNGVSAQMYALGIQDAYRNGKYNYAFRTAENDPYSDAMKLAWNEGRMSALSESRRRQAEVDAKYSEAKKKRTGNEKSGEHQAVLEKGITAMSLNESQKASYRLADSIAQAAKVDIIVYAGKTGELGFYDPNTDTIHLNLNGMNKSRKSMMAFTLGHELVHRAKKGSPAKYQAFADFLVENYGKRGADLEAMIAEQLAAAKEHEKKMTRDQAFEEVVCDACQRMLLDTDAGKKLAQFGAESRQNKSILSEIKRWIEEFMEKLLEIFKGVEPDSLAAKEFAKFDDGVKQILADMYVDMTVDAGEHLSTIQEAFGKDTIVRTNEQGEFTVAESKDGSGKVFNLTTWENGGRETLEATLLREGYTRDEVDAALTIMDGKQKLVEAIANELDGNGKPAFPEQGRINAATLTTDIKDGHAVLSALVSNGDYPVNIDLLMVCKKRKAYQRVINRLCETGMIKQATLDSLAIAEINKILGKYGFETACLGCFVESRRLRIQEWAQTIVREWNGEVKKRNPNAKAFSFGKGEAKLTQDEVMQLIGELESGGEKNDQGNLNLGQGSAVKRMGVLLDKVPSLRRTLSVEDLITPDGLTALRRFDGNLFSIVKSRYGSNSPKFVQEFNPYNHELAKYGKVPSEYKSLREYLYAIGGARMQSFSDFIVENWFDYCQIVADLAAKKLPMHTYTKEIALAKLFGMTGIKINMSLIPDVDRSLGKEYAGLTRNANGELELIWADKDRFKATGGKSYMQSINFADAVALQNDPRYSANVGTIAIGISDMQIRMMLADPRIRMVIPYHSSGMNPIYADLMGTSFYKDYTNFQNTTVKQLYNSDGKPVSLKLSKTQSNMLTNGFLFNEVLQELGDARAAADAYIEWCADASKHTITINGQTYTAELTPKFADFASEENYYKLLEDFNTYDCVTEEAAPQVDVQQVYPDGFEDILRAELSGQERYRQKQEKNQAFDKAMGEIEGYLNSHTKADTVYYAEQHGVKLGAKDKKLGAEDKARLKQLREDGVSFKLPIASDGAYQEPSFHEWDVQAALYDAMDHADSGYDNMIRVGEMPRYITKMIGIEGDFYIYRNHAYENMVSREQAIKDGRPVTRKGEEIHFHDLGVDTMTEAIMSLENPTMTIAAKTAEGNPAVIMILPVHGKNKAPLYAVLSFYSNRHINGDMSRRPHVVLTIAERDFFGSDGRSGYAEIIGNAVNDGRVIDFNKEMRDDLSVIANPAGVGNITDSSLNNNISRFRKEIKAFREKNHINYKLPVGDDTSPRALLANAYEELAKTDAEKESIRKYQERVTQFQELETKLKDLRAQIRELYTADGKLDTKKIRELQFEANATANRIETLDRMLLRTESTQQFQNVLKREQDQARAREIKKAKDAVIAFRHDASAEIRETMRDYEAARSALVGRDSDMDIIEREFLRVVKEYEKAKRSGEKTAESLRRSLEKEVKKHQKDNDLWEREFNRMLRQYEKSRDYIGVLERRVDKAKQVRDNAAKRDAVGKLQKLVLDTTNWITYPGKKDVKCPDLLKKPYADFLNSIDMSSKRLASGGDPTKNDLKLANAMGSLATALESITMAQDPSQDAGTHLDSGYLDLPAGFVQTLREMTEKIKDMIPEGQFVVSTMTADDVKQLSKMIRTLNHAIREMSTLYANSRFASVAELSGESMRFMDSLGEMEKTSGAADFVKWDNVLPYYAFKRFGTGGESVFEGLMDAQDKLAFLAQKIFDFQENTWTGKEAKAWGEDSHTIDLPSGGKLTLTTADAMSIYCLSRRQQGLQHLLGGGVRVIGIQKGSTKAKDSRSTLSIQDIDAITYSLTEKQKTVAEAIQGFMSKECSQWGNEISMKRFLTREFNEQFYFPIEPNDENLATKDPSAQQSDLFRLLNISATKPLTKNANNEVIIRNIFDVFTGHASDMARLNAFGMPLLDYMKWLNYREKTTNEDGQVTVRGVRKSMETAFGSAAKSYVLNLIKDVNGRASDGGDPSFLMKMMRNAKTAAVGNSLRVATLQMTSYPRAALVLSPKSLALGLTRKPNINRAMKYCGIALWKSFGFYDTNISRSIEDQMKGVASVKQKMIELSLKGAELGDALTWGVLWNACEYEVAKTTRNKVGSEEFYQEVGKKLREVVYATQVVDSTLTRSQIMRSKRGMAQEAAAFMSEPTLSANILMDAGFQFSMEKRRTGSAKEAWKTTGKYVGRAIAVYSIGQITAAIVEALWDAWRDDDDDEYIEKYWKALKQNLVLDILPFNKIPVISDVVEMVLATAGVGFFSSEKLSTTWLSQAKSAVDAWSDVLNSEGSVTAYGALYKTMRAVSSAYGVSFSGVMREGVALWNNTAGAYDSTLKIRTYELSKSTLAGELLDALVKGDDRRAESLREEFNDADDAKSNLRTAIKNRFASGEIDKSTAMKYLVLYGEMDAGDAYWKVDAWSFDNLIGDGEEYSKYGGFYDAVETGENLSEVIRSYTDNGVDMETLRREITEHFQPVYSEMTAAERAGIREYLINAYEQCGSSREDAEGKLQYWDFLAENPGSNLSIFQVADYYEYAKPAGISAEVYSDYCERVKGITGEGKKARRMAVIDALPITNAQKDALYFAEGWAESKIHEAPWH